MIIRADHNYLDFLSGSSRFYYFSEPKLTDRQRSLYFDLNQDESKYFRDLRGNDNKLYFVLLSGYFKATLIIYNLIDIHIPHEDIAFICERFQIDTSSYDINKNSITRLKDAVCSCSSIGQYQPKKHRNILSKHAQKLTVLHAKPIFIFTELLRKLSDLELSMPSYREFQIIISESIRAEEQRLEAIIDTIPDDIDADIMSLLKSDDMFNLTSIIALPKNVSNKEIDTELKRWRRVKKIHLYASDFIPMLGITKESIKYFSSLVKYYGCFKLSTMSSPMIKLYILCYINYRCQRINDNLIDSFQALVSRYYTEAHIQANCLLGESKALYEAHENKLANILDFYTMSNNGEMLFSEVKRRAFKILPKKTLTKAVSYMRHKDNRRNKIIWQLLGEAQNRFKKNIRRIFLHLDIDTTDKHLADACQFIKDRLKTGNLNKIEYHLYPQDVIPPYLAQAIRLDEEGKQQIPFGRFEFLVYDLLSDHLSSGDASVADSVNFRSFENDLLPNDVVEQQDLKALGISMLDVPIKQHLRELKEELEGNIENTNQNISLGINRCINIKDWDKRQWTLPYRKQDIETNHEFFEKLDHVNIVDVTNFVNAQTDFLSSFTHLLNKNVKNEINLKNLSATLIAKATNHGIYRMSKISDISYGSLRQCSKSYVTLENVKQACDLLSNEIKKLEIFDYYDINNILHGSIDGQKFKTKRDCLKSRPSAKCFHLGKGVSAGTLLVNHVPANATLFGSSEHESRFVFDLVYNNETEIQPTIISTDSAGNNCVNFALLNLIGREFAPCFKRVNNKESMLSGFNKLSKYKYHFLRPSTQIKEGLIIDEWPNIKRIMASLALKNTAQSVIVRKLCGTAIKNQTKEAFWEYDRIVRSNYLLRYIDDETLRRSVRTAQNRVESFHQLKRTIATINAESLIGLDDDDIVLNDQCTRLLCLVVIYYNAYILSEIVKIKKKEGKEKDIEYFRHISLIAWIHINFYGHYNFNSEISIDMIRTMIDHATKEAAFSC